MQSLHASQNPGRPSAPNANGGLYLPSDSPVVRQAASSSYTTGGLPTLGLAGYLSFAPHYSTRLLFVKDFHIFRIPWYGYLGLVIETVHSTTGHRAPSFSRIMSCHGRLHGCLRRRHHMNPTSPWITQTTVQCPSDPSLSTPEEQWESSKWCCKITKRSRGISYRYARRLDHILPHFPSFSTGQFSTCKHVLVHTYVFSLYMHVFDTSRYWNTE